MFHDHRVQGRAVFPGAGYLELAVSGAFIMTGDTAKDQLVQVYIICELPDMFYSES